MIARDLLLQLRAKGVEVKTSGNDRLVIDAPKGIINEELRSALSANKAELLRILNAEQGGPADAAVSKATEPVPSAPQVASIAVKPLPWAPKVISPAAEEPVSAAPQAPAMPSIKHDEETTIAV